MGQIFGPIGYFFNEIFTYPIFNALMLLYHLFGDMALSIIVLTVIIRLLLFPLYMKQLKSTKATQAIQPLMADIKKKYAKDQRAQMEAMQAAAASILPGVRCGRPTRRRSSAARRPSPETLSMLSSSGETARLRMASARLPRSAT